MPIEKLKLTTSNDKVILPKEIKDNLLKRSNEYIENTEIAGVHHNDETVIFNGDGDTPEYQGEFFLAPQRLQAEGILELQILQQNRSLPSHIKIINSTLNVDDEGYVTLQKLEKPLIVKIVESDETDDNAEDESSTDYSDSDNDIEYQSLKKYSLYIDENNFPEILDYEKNKFSDEEDFNYTQDSSFDDGNSVDSDYTYNKFLNEDDFGYIHTINVNDDDNGLDDDGVNDFEDDDTKSEEVIISEKSTSPRPITIGDDLQRELACYKRLTTDAKCPQIVINGTTCYSIFDYIPGQILTDVIKDKIKFSYNNSPESILVSIRQAVQAVKFIHDRGIVHGDLKPDNLIMAENEKKMTVFDFGGAAIIGIHNEVIDYTHHYVPPEYYHLAKNKKDLPVDIRIDFYALGVISLHCLLYAFDDAGMDERALNRNRGLKAGGFCQNTYHTELYPEINTSEFFENWQARRINKINKQKNKLDSPQFFENWKSNHLKKITKKNNKIKKNDPYFTLPTLEKINKDLLDEFNDIIKREKVDLDKNVQGLKSEFEIMVKAFKEDMQNLSEKFAAFGPVAGPLLKKLIDSLLNKDPNLRPVNCDIILAKLDVIEVALHLKGKCQAKFFQAAQPPMIEKPVVENYSVCNLQII